MKKLALLLVLAAAGVALLLLVPRERLPEFAAWVREQGVRGALLLAAIYVVATVLMVPGSVLTLLIGFLYGPRLGVLVVSPASLAGCTLAFLLGRTLARDWIRRKMAASARFLALQQALDRRGLTILLLVRLSPDFPFVLLNYAFGLTTISTGRYVLGSFAGMIPGTFLYVYLGSAAGDVSQLLAGGGEVGSSGGILKWAGLAATVIVTVIVTGLARRALRAQAPAVVDDSGQS